MAEAQGKGRVSEAERRSTPTRSAEPSAKKTRGRDTRAREFYVVDECRNRIEKLLMDEGAKRVESFFDRARVREETSTGGAVSI